eukprot:gene5283-7159_t
MTDVEAKGSDAAVLPARAGRRLVGVLGALTVVGPFAIDMYLPALPQIARELGVDMGGVELTLSVFMIGVAVGQAFYGPIVDRWGRRGPLLIGKAVFTLAAVGCAWAEAARRVLADSAHAHPTAAS